MSIVELFLPNDINSTLRCNDSLYTDIVQEHDRLAILVFRCYYNYVLLRSNCIEPPNYCSFNNCCSLFPPPLLHSSLQIMLRLCLTWALRSDVWDMWIFENIVCIYLCMGIIFVDIIIFYCRGPHPHWVSTCIVPLDLLHIWSAAWPTFFPLTYFHRSTPHLALYFTLTLPSQLNYGSHPLYLNAPL